VELLDAATWEVCGLKTNPVGEAAPLIALVEPAGFRVDEMFQPWWLPTDSDGARGTITEVALLCRVCVGAAATLEVRDEGEPDGRSEVLAVAATLDVSLGLECVEELRAVEFVGTVAEANGRLVVGVVVENMVMLVGAFTIVVLGAWEELTIRNVLLVDIETREVDGEGEGLVDASEAGMPPVLDDMTNVVVLIVPEGLSVEIPVDVLGSTGDVAETVEEGDGVHVSVALT
jgi:hypothetical protein